MVTGSPARRTGRRAGGTSATSARAGAQAAGAAGSAAPGELPRTSSMLLRADLSAAPPRACSLGRREGACAARLAAVAWLRGGRLWSTLEAARHLRWDSDVGQSAAQDGSSSRRGAGAAASARRRHGGSNRDGAQRPAGMRERHAPVLEGSSDTVEMLPGGGGPSFHLRESRVFLTCHRISAPQAERLLWQRPMFACRAFCSPRLVCDERTALSLLDVAAPRPLPSVLSSHKSSVNIAQNPSRVDAAATRGAGCIPNGQTTSFASAGRQRVSLANAVMHEALPRSAAFLFF